MGITVVGAGSPLRPTNATCLPMDMTVCLDTRSAEPSSKIALSIRHLLKQY